MTETKAEREKASSDLVCWRCGHTLKEIPRPITRLSRCIECRADLHVCRLCRHYDRTVLGECRHERAERIVDKELANFCTYFRPRPDAHASDGRDDERKARDELDALFGGAPGEVEGDAEPASGASASDDARAQLDALFGPPSDD